jgi:hypothetical protein
MESMMNNVLYTVLSIIWIYFFGWIFLGGLLAKVIPGPNVARIIGAVIGFLTAGGVIAFLL